MTSAAVLAPPDDYLDLVRRFPLTHLRDDAHLKQGCAMADELTDRTLSEGEDLYLQALFDLIETYEDAHVVLPRARGVDVLRLLMDEHDLTQAGLAPLFGTQSIVSEVLAGKRRLSLSHIRKLADHFNLPADVFLD